MKETFAVLGIMAIIVIIIPLAIVLCRMFKHHRNVKKIDYLECPKFIFDRYSIWYSSYSLWTFVEYILILIPLFTSIGTVYFTNEILTAPSPNGHNSLLLSIMSFTSALLPLINSRILPKVHADGFYKGMSILGYGIIKHKAGVISTPELIELAEKAEKYTHPLANNDYISRPD